MNIKIDNTDYTLDVDMAKAVGVLKEIKSITLTLTENEAAVLEHQM